MAGDLLTSPPDLVVVVLYLNRLQVFGFKYLAAVETFDIIDPIAASDDLRAVVVTGGLHNQLIMRFILSGSNRLSSPLSSTKVLHPPLTTKPGAQYNIIQRLGGLGAPRPNTILQGLKLCIFFVCYPSWP